MRSVLYCHVTHEVQQGEVQTPVPVEEQPHTLIYDGCHPDGKQLCRKDPGVVVDTQLNNS